MFKYKDERNFDAFHVNEKFIYYKGFYYVNSFIPVPSQLAIRNAVLQKLRYYDNKMTREEFDYLFTEYNRNAMDTSSFINLHQNDKIFFLKGQYMLHEILKRRERGGGRSDLEKSHMNDKSHHGALFNQFKSLIYIMNRLSLLHCSNSQIRDGKMKKMMYMTQKTRKK